MSILGRYLTLMFLGQLALILISAVALLQLFDVMSVADDLLQELGGTLEVTLRYSLLRLPVLVTFMLPFSVLIAALTTFGRLHRHSELVAIQALGQSFPRTLILLLPAMLVVALLHFLISDQLTPRSIRALADWEASTKVHEPDDIALWLRDGDDLVSVGRIEDDGRRLEDVVIFGRDANGNLTAQTKADHAIFDQGSWWLNQVNALAARPHAERSKTISERQAWQTAILPGLVEDLAAPPNALSIARLKQVLEHPEIGSRPVHVYQTWLHKSFALPLASLFMVVLAAASVRGLQRQGGVVVNALVGFGGAFLYFVSDGVLQALGEAGSVAPALAAWLPLLILALSAGAVLYWVVMPRGRRQPSAMPTASDSDAPAVSA